MYLTSGANSYSTASLKIVTEKVFFMGVAVCSWWGLHFQVLTKIYELAFNENWFQSTAGKYSIRKILNVSDVYLMVNTLKFVNLLFRPTRSHIPSSFELGLLLLFIFIIRNKKLNLNFKVMSVLFMASHFWKRAILHHFLEKWPK